MSANENLGRWKQAALAVRNEVKCGDGAYVDITTTSQETMDRDVLFQRRESMTVERRHIHHGMYFDQQPCTVDVAVLRRRVW